MSVRALKSEDGGAVLMVLAFLLSLGLLSALWLAVSSAELFIGAARRAEHRRHYASEGAMEEALAALAAPGAGTIPADVLGNPPHGYATDEQAGVFAGMGYRWRASFIADSHDRDNDPATATVLFNRAFGYEGSPFSSGGYPVVRIDLGIHDGAGASKVRAEVTPVVLRPRAAAAWTGGGELLFQKSVTLSGHQHDEDGVGTGESAVPAVVAEGAVHLADGARIAGEPPLQEEMPGVLPGDLLALLNGGDTVRSLSAFPEPPAGGGCLDGMYAAARDFTGPLCGRGVLIVHNPGFDPVRYEASRLFTDEGIATDGLDPAYSHLAPDHRPARIDIHRGGTFRGFVVADTIGFIYDRTSIRGAVVTLSRSPSAVTGEQPLEVLFSRAALDASGLGRLAHRLGVLLAGAGLFHEE